MQRVVLRGTALRRLVLLLAVIALSMVACTIRAVEGSLSGLAAGPPEVAGASPSPAAQPSPGASPEDAGPAASPDPSPAATPGRQDDETSWGAVSKPTRSSGPSGRDTPWLSGAAGETVAAGQFGRWRGSEVEIAGTWAVTPQAARELYQLKPGAEYGSWQSDLDIAVGAIWKQDGESWAAAARGAYDDRWRSQLVQLRDLWGDRPGTVWIRFGHEFNGAWMAWSVRGSEVDDYLAAWRRYRALQQEIVPRHRLVWSPNDGTDSRLALDVRDAFPGARYVDAVAISTYNWWPYVATADAFQTKVTARHHNGAPLGLESWRQDAERWGVPLGLAEWGQHSDPRSAGGGGDSPIYVQQLRSWLEAHGGPGPGQVVYEIVFAVSGHGSNTYGLYPASRMPETAATYRELW